MPYQLASDCWQVRHDWSSSGQERDDRSNREKGMKGLRGHREGQKLGAVNNSGCEQPFQPGCRVSPHNMPAFI